MQDLIHALLFIGVFGLIFLAIILWEAWYLARQGRNSYSWRETLANISTGATYKVFDGIAVALFIQVFYEYVRGFGLQLEFEAGLFAFLLLFVTQDFFYYLYHFTMHKVRWFWANHVTHHSSKNLNFSTALRQNFLMDLNFSWAIWWLPLALIGFEKNWALIAIEASLAYQFFLHTETVKRLGAIEWVFNTPSHHRVHHGCKPDQIDRNFGGVLIIWDRLFGTFVDESKVGQLQYGLNVRQPETFNPLRLNLDELVQMFKDVWHYRDVKIFYKSPSYVEETYKPDTGEVVSGTSSLAAK